MEVLFLHEADVERLLTMEVALEAVEAVFRAAAAGRAHNQARRRLRAARGTLLHYMAATDQTTGYFGMKLYTSSPTGLRFLVPLYRSDTGALVALLEADQLGCVRTGAASGIATKYMARKEAGRLALLGSGHQAPTQLLALAQVRRLTEVRVYSPHPEHRGAFAERMNSLHALPVVAVDTAEKAVEGTDIVVTVTSAKDPVLEGRWLAPGTHINAVGANSAGRRELDDTTVNRTARVVVDSREQSQEEAGDLIAPFRDHPDRWEAVRELSEVVGGTFPGRGDPQEITLFKSNGVALEDVAAAVRVYERARVEGVGQRLTFW